MSRTDQRRGIRIATRESRLALWQANHVAECIRAADPRQRIELVPISTAGDRNRLEPLSEIGGEGLFTREVQRLVLQDQADMAVHSLKDLPTEPLEGLTLAGVPARAPRWDTLILPASACGGTASPTNVDSLPQGARIGTGSPRRRAQLLHLRPDLLMQDIRGNVETRIQKLDAGEYDAVILAEAGLRRLGLEERISAVLTAPLMYPAVAQAALGVECRSGDAKVATLLERISDPPTRCEVLAERACLRTLRAGCHAPVGVLSSVNVRQMQFEAVVLSPDGTRRFHVSLTGNVDDPEEVGVRAARALLEQGASVVLN